MSYNFYIGIRPVDFPADRYGHIHKSMDVASGPFHLHSMYVYSGDEATYVQKIKRDGEEIWVTNMDRKLFMEILGSLREGYNAVLNSCNSKDEKIPVGLSMLIPYATSYCTSGGIAADFPGIEEFNPSDLFVAAYLVNTRKREEMAGWKTKIVDVPREMSGEVAAILSDVFPNSGKLRDDAERVCDSLHQGTHHYNGHIMYNNASVSNLTPFRGIIRGGIKTDDGTALFFYPWLSERDRTISLLLHSRNGNNSLRLDEINELLAEKDLKPYTQMTYAYVPV